MASALMAIPAAPQSANPPALAAANACARTLAAVRMAAAPLAMLAAPQSAARPALAAATKLSTADALNRAAAQLAGVPTLAPAVALSAYRAQELLAKQVLLATCSGVLPCSASPLLLARAGCS